MGTEHQYRPICNIDVRGNDVVAVPLVCEPLVCHPAGYESAYLIFVEGR